MSPPSLDVLCRFRQDVIGAQANHLNRHGHSVPDQDFTDIPRHHRHQIESAVEVLDELRGKMVSSHP